MAADQPSQARFVLLGWLCLLTAILYLDRVCVAQAIEPIQAELGLSNTETSYVLMAFTLAYGLFEVPTGCWGDRVGARTVLTRISVWWSVFTALTGACAGFTSLLVVRFLFGAGEAGAYPNIARVLSRWFPASERGRVQGVLLTASQLGAVAAPALAAYLIAAFGWRWAFVVFGMVGVCWSAGFWFWFRDNPAEHPAVNLAELQWIGTPGPAMGAHRESIPWLAVLANPSIWLLGTIITCAAFNSYLFYSWFTKYLMSARGVGNVEAGWLTSLVLAGSAVGMFVGGIVVDRIVASGRDAVRIRRLVGGTAFGLAAVFLHGVARCESPLASASLAALSSLAASSTLPMWWSCAIEISGRHVGALFGLMNMMGVVGALGSQYFIGAFTDWRASQGFAGRAQWDPALTTYVVLLCAAAFCWLLYRSRPVEAR